MPCNIVIPELFGSTGKNPYAVSVLRRMEMKLDGRDIVDDRYRLSMKILDDSICRTCSNNVICGPVRELSVGEQVDYLLKQATSIDNLCNMYEGWTPWI